MDIFIDVEKRPARFCPLLHPHLPVLPAAPAAHGNSSSRGLERGSERRGSGKSENSFPWIRGVCCLVLVWLVVCFRAVRPAACGTPGPGSRFQPGRAGHGSGARRGGPRWRKCWRPSGTTGRNPPSEPVCWAGADTGSTGSTGNAGWGRAGPGGRERWRKGERLKRGSPVGAARQPAGMNRPPAPAVSGDGSLSCRAAAAASVPLAACPPRPRCKTGAGSGGRFKQRGCVAGMSRAGASRRGEGFLSSNLNKNAMSHTRAFSLPALSLCKYEWSQACRVCSAWCSCACSHPCLL